MQMRSKYLKNAGKHFELTTVKSIEEIEQIRPIWEEMQANEPSPQINADIDRYLSVLKASNDDLQPYILLVKENGQPIAMLIGRIQKTHVKCEIGRKTLFEPVLKEVCVVYGGLIGKNTDEICSLLVREVMRVLASGQADMVSFNHMRMDCPLYKFARKIPAPFCKGHLPKIEAHESMQIPRTFEEFLESCSHNRRRNYKRWTEKLERCYPGQIRMVTYSTEEEVLEALRIASGISEKTYQRAFGGGIVDDQSTRALFRAAAGKDWLRVHILFVGDEPTAFWTALRYGRTYFAEVTGYCPEWRDMHVGTICFFKVLHDVCGDPLLDVFDFSWGEGQHKEWGQSKKWPEGTISIFAPRFFPVFVNLVKSLTLGMNLLAQYLVTKLGILYFVQRYRRRYVLRKSSRAEGRAAAVGGEEKRSL